MMLFLKKTSVASRQPLTRDSHFWSPFCLFILVNTSDTAEDGSNGKRGGEGEEKEEETYIPIHHRRDKQIQFLIVREP